MAALPDGLTSRPLFMADAAAVHAVMAAQELADVGRVEIELDDIVGDWQRPSHDLAASSAGVLDGDRLVAYAEVTAEFSYDCAVHPDVRGRGVGTWLAGWAQELARRRGLSVLGMPVPQGSPGDRLLERLGYGVRWDSWVLRLPPEVAVQDRPLPTGYAVREALEPDRPAVHRVVEDAFLEWSERERQSYADFAATVWQRPSFEPWHLQVVTDPGGDVVGVAHAWNADLDATPDTQTETYVARLAVRADQRGQGLAQALLAQTFALGRDRGALTGALSTDSRTGALTLYEKVGMRVESVWRHRAVVLHADGTTSPAPPAAPRPAR